MKDKKRIICIDSDGCVMNTMTYKHNTYFGPFAIEEWNIQDTETFQKVWNWVNLFSETRGCNRFVGLYLAFEYLHKNDSRVPLLNDVKAWATTTNELSNPSLEREIAKTGSEQLKQTLRWSLRSNDAINNQTKPSPTFEGVHETFKALYGNVDIVVMSSTHRAAIIKEWTQNDLLKYTSRVFTQEDGSKKDAIAILLKESGLAKNEILMVGDSPGDNVAAQANGIYFFPIVFEQEEVYWNFLGTKVLEKFLAGKYDREEEAKHLNTFNNNLKRSVNL